MSQKLGFSRISRMEESSVLTEFAFCGAQRQLVR